MPLAVLISCDGSIAHKILFCKYHSAPFIKVKGNIKLEHILDLANKNCKVFLLMAAIVKWQNSGLLYRLFDRSRPFRHQRLSKSLQ